MRNEKKAIALVLSFSLIAGCLSGTTLLEAKKKATKSKTAGLSQLVKTVLATKKKTTKGKTKTKAKTKTKTTKTKGDKTVQKVTVLNVPGKKLYMKKGGHTFKIKARLKLKKNSKASKKLVYRTSNKSIVSVNAKGVLKAKKIGKAKITIYAKANPAKKVVLTVTVSTKINRVKKITLNKKTLTLYIGSDIGDDDDDTYEDDEESGEDEDEDISDEDDDEEMDEVEDDGSLGDDEYELIAKISPTTAAAAKLVWTSSNTNVVEVDQDGFVLAMAAGTANVTVTAKDGSNKSATCKVKVIDLTEDEDDSDDTEDGTDDEDIEE